ncbi:MAG: sensor histidine kinase [Pseudomonadota bacterium]|nr:sensor histidine kinase [Pseudomonadota bacterium]
MSDRPEQFVIPELCNKTSLAMLIVFSELLVVVLFVAGVELSWIRLGLMSLFVQSVALVSAGVLCYFRGWLATTHLRVGVTLAFLIVQLVTVMVGLGAEWAFAIEGNIFVRMGSQLAVSSIITGLLLRYFYVQQRLRAQERAELQSRIQALQSRIRPHFLFNSMNIIASLIAVDPDTAEAVVEDLSELFRASLNDAGGQVPITDELNLCERYLRIEGLRLGDRLNMDWRIQETDHTALIPLLTLQPLLENAIYHGIQPLPEGGTIVVELKYVEDMVHIRIENPIPPDGNKRESEGNQMALQNIRSRLSVLYGHRAGLSAGSFDGRFVTSLHLPKMTDAV